MAFGHEVLSRVGALDEGEEGLDLFVLMQVLGLHNI